MKSLKTSQAGGRLSLAGFGKFLVNILVSTTDSQRRASAIFFGFTDPFH